MNPRQKTPSPRPSRKRATPSEDGVAAVQRVFVKVLEKADPTTAPKAKR